ncbi:hypothetical protein GKD53_21650 [Parabacteroides distasonis]|uniref:hypothetical protein n=1 Tax=Parabacteroides distasonis TaxID=823 RepID=UPI0013125195|nr:hypothetical protein [Parabacteroides distasonis]MRZ26831.1 hypothetical protein [Parabacteroides distasonis]
MRHARSLRRLVYITEKGVTPYGLTPLHRLSPCLKTAATYSSTVTQYHRRDEA